MSARVSSWIIVACPVCRAPAGTRCREGSYSSLHALRQHSHEERRRDGYQLHSVWEAAGAKPMFE